MYRQINAYILAGGKSSRMGTDKGLLLLNNKPLIEWIITELQLVFESITIVSGNNAYSQFGLELIEDEIENLGPAGGIYTALKHSLSEKIFIVSCDMPFITVDAIEFVVNHSSGSQITVPVYQQKMQPLLAVYAKNCLPQWAKLIGQKMIKLQLMLGHFDLCKLDVDDNPLFAQKLMMNINDKKDLEKACNV